MASWSLASILGAEGRKTTKVATYVLMALVSFLVCLTAGGLAYWGGFLDLSANQWKLFLYTIAMVNNGLLCSTQVVVLISLFDFDKDHMNHYDVEDAVRQLVFPEQMLQLLLTIVHSFNLAGYHVFLQLPIAAWHVFCIATRRPSLRVVLGRPEEFKQSLSDAKRFYALKTFLYGATLVFLITSWLDVFAKVVLASKTVHSMFQAVHAALPKSVVPAEIRQAAKQLDELHNHLLQDQVPK